MNPTAVFSVAAILFFIGAFGVLFRRSAVFTVMSLEIMLNAVNLALVGAFNVWGDPVAQAGVAVIMAIAAAEVAIGLAIIVLLARHGDVRLDVFRTLASDKEED